MPPARQTRDRVAAVRRFNRFYTRQIGVLRKNYLDSPYSLGEMRVLYELSHGEVKTATDIGRALDLDAGYLSRVLRNFEKRGLISRKTSAADARQSDLALTARGAKIFAPLEQRSQDLVGGMLGRLESRRAGAAGGGDDDDRNAAWRAARRRRRETILYPARSRATAISAGSFPGTPSFTRKNTAGSNRSRACARRSSPTSSTSSTPSASAAGSPS